MRQIKDIKAAVKSLPVEGDVVALLKSHGGRYRFLLAHCEGGVVWGRVENDALILAPGSDLLLTAQALQEARLFGDDGELHVWRIGEAKFRARELRDDANAAQDDCTYAQAFDELQVLWGDQVVSAASGFSLMEDGAQGLRHWAPVTVNDTRKGGRRLRLRVRSYLTKDGPAKVSDARLVNVEVVEG